MGVIRTADTARGDKARVGFAERLDALTPEKRALLSDALRKRRSAGIPRRRDIGPAPLSFSQQRIWFLDQWDPGAPTWNGARAMRMLGELDVDALQAAFEGVVERHESLRTVFPGEGREPRQVVLEDWAVRVPVVDLGDLPPDERERELPRLLREEARRTFDLRTDVTLRPTLFRLGSREHVLMIALHHISFDASSDPVLNREVAELYGAFRAGRPPRLPELPIQYADFAAWQRTRLQGEVLDDLVTYWRAQLAGVPARLRLPTDRARPAVQRHEGSHHYVSFDPALGRTLGELARAEGATIFMAFLAAFDTLLYRFTGQEDILVGSPIANRNHRELEGLIGFFSNTLVLRNRLGGNPSFRELLRRVRENAVGAYAHQELPFEKLVETLRVPRDPSYNPLFQVNFRAQAANAETLQLPGLTATPIAVDLSFSRFDLALELQVAKDALTGYFEYDVALLDLATIERLAADFAALLRELVRAPDAPILALGGARSSGRAKTAGRIPRGTH